MGSRIRRYIPLCITSILLSFWLCGCVFNVDSTVNLYEKPKDIVSSDSQRESSGSQSGVSSQNSSSSGASSKSESKGGGKGESRSDADTEADVGEGDYSFEYESGEFLEAPPPSIATKDGFSSETVEKELLFLINLARKDSKCAPLKKQSLLQWSARVRSVEYSLNGASDSAGIDGSWAESLDAVGYSSYDEVNEAATLLQDVESLYLEAKKVDNAVLARLIFDAWRSNDDLNVLILSTQTDEVGISVIRDNHDLYAVAHFGSRTEE